MEHGERCYRRFLEGDEDGLLELVRLYSDSLLLFLYGMVHNLSLAEELMEETFAELVLHRGAFRGEASLKTYLFRVGRNKALNQLKKQSRVTLLPIEEATAVADVRSLEDLVLRTERQKCVRRGIQRLSPPYQQVLYLLYFEELSYQQAGAVMRRSEKQIKNLAYRARQSLKVVLQEEGWDDEDV